MSPVPISPPGRPHRSRRPRRHRDRRRSSRDAKRYFLIRFWLATPEARAADPAPLGDVAALAEPAPAARLCAPAGDQRTARHRRLCAARGGLFAGLRPGRADQSRVRRTRRGGRLCRGVGRGADGRRAARRHSRPLRCVYAVFVAGTWGVAAGRWVFQPLHRASGQIALVATVGLALFLQEFLRLTQGSRLNWVSPIFNRAVRRRARRRFRRHDGAERAAGRGARVLRRRRADRADDLDPVRPELARLCRRSARRADVRGRPQRDFRARRSRSRADLPGSPALS